MVTRYIALAVTALMTNTVHATLVANPLEKPQGFAGLGGTTGGAGGWIDTAETIKELQDLAKKAGKGIIYVKGTMGDAGSKSTMGGDRVTLTNDKSILGLPGATVKGGFDVKNVSNVIIRNLAVWGPGAYDIDGNDPIHIEGATAKNIWVDHCLISDGQDGNLDITNGATNVTVTWNKFSYTTLSSNHQYCNLIGSSATKTADTIIKVTMAWNWWADGVVERMPRVRFGKVHVINNLVKTNTSNYAVRAGQNANILVEKNAYIKTKNPIDIFTDEKGQMVKVTDDNYFENTSGTQAGISPEKVFTAPYTLTGLIDAKVLDAKVSDAADGAGPTIDIWSTSNVGIDGKAASLTGVRLSRTARGSELINGEAFAVTATFHDLSGRIQGESLTLLPGQRAAVPAVRAAQVARLKADGLSHQLLVLP
ncbi:MAG: hypothetical protein RL318_899 [Fibrobacterota bacterium]|jgi:pectate lyase